jgi:hypothetical protein
MSTECCRTCRAWRDGYCCAELPKARDTYWPPVNDSDWCARWRAHEAKPALCLITGEYPSVDSKWEDCCCSVCERYRRTVTKSVIHLDSYELAGKED